MLLLQNAKVNKVFSKVWGFNWADAELTLSRSWRSSRFTQTLWHSWFSDTFHSGAPGLAMLEAPRKLALSLVCWESWIQRHCICMPLGTELSVAMMGFPLSYPFLGGKCIWQHAAIPSSVHLYWDGTLKNLIHASNNEPAEKKVQSSGFKSTSPDGYFR